MNKRWIVSGLAALALAGGAVSAAQASTGTVEPARGPRGNGRVDWQRDGGTPTVKGDSVDGAKKSNAYHFETTVYDPETGQPTSGGGYVYPKGYNPTLSNVVENFSYKTTELTGAGQIMFAILDWDTSETLAFLDPAHCPGVASGAWSTTNFRRTGADCTIYTPDGAFSGTDAVADDPSTPLVDEAKPATSAWGAFVAHSDSAARPTWSFLTAQADAITVDRVQVAGSTLSEF